MSNLDGYPAALIDQYLAFAEDGNLMRLDRVVLGVLQFNLANPPPEALTVMAGSTRLVDDLGCDSLTMVDMLFVAEEIFGVKISDDELSRVTTLDDLRAHFRRHVAPGATVM